MPIIVTKGLEEVVEFVCARGGNNDLLEVFPQRPGDVTCHERADLFGALNRVPPLKIHLHR